MLSNVKTKLALRAANKALASKPQAPALVASKPAKPAKPQAPAPVASKPAKPQAPVAPAQAPVAKGARKIEGSNPNGAIAQGFAGVSSAKITLLCAANPRMPGRATHARFAVLMAHANMPVATYLQAGGNAATLRNAIAQGHAKVPGYTPAK